MPNSAQSSTIAITGSNGFIGRLLLSMLPDANRLCLGFDRYEGPLFRLLTTRFLQPLPLARIHSLQAWLARKSWAVQKRLLALLRRAKIIRPGSLNILDDRAQWIERFRGIDAVIHLAAIPHPDYPGMTPQDYVTINYDGAVNIFEAAAAAGVKRFLFASSGQVYDINHNKDLNHFPIPEEMADHVQQTRTLRPYSTLKWKFEKYLLERSAPAGITSLALRLEYPGIFAGSSWNLWLQTSVENLVHAFSHSLTAPLPPGGYVINICNGEVPAQLGNLQELLPQHRPNAVNHGTGNQSLLDLTAARKLIGYAPTPNGSYYLESTVF